MLVASGASLVLGALVALAGPLDLLARYACRSSPIVDHPFGWGSRLGSLFHKGPRHELVGSPSAHTLALGPMRGGLLRGLRRL